MTKLMICRMGWMDSYPGITKIDRIKSTVGYIKEHGWGDEIYNFLRGRDRVFGFVQVKGSNNLLRLGGAPGAESVAGVTVVWAACHPRGGVYVVGWYRNAAVYKDYQYSPNDPRRQEPGKNTRMGWNITAKEKDAHLLPDSKRRFRLPVGRNALGMSLTNYVDGPTKSEKLLRQRLLKYVASGGDAGLPSKKGKKAAGGYQQDPATRIRVEKAAMDRVEKWYRDQNWDIRQVHRDNVGWDLEARLDNRLLLLEVKGCSSNEPWCELTPNEFAKMNLKKYKQTYRVCIVTNALKKTAKIWQFGFVDEKGGWRDEDDNTLTLKERIAASGSVTQKS
jgi:hypothetical protein